METLKEMIEKKVQEAFNKIGYNIEVKIYQSKQKGVDYQCNDALKLFYRSNEHRK